MTSRIEAVARTVLRCAVALSVLSHAVPAAAGSPFQPPSDAVPRVASFDVDGGEGFVAGENFGIAQKPVVLLGGTTLTGWFSEVRCYYWMYGPFGTASKLTAKAICAKLGN